MQKAIIVTLLAVVLPCAGPPALAACSKPLVMVTEEWPPYVFNDKRMTGLDVELARAIVKEAGCTLIVDEPLPIVRRMLLFRQGKFDLMLAASDTPERRGFARFTVPYRHETVALFALAESADSYRDIDSFAAMAARRVTLLAPKLGWYGADYARHHDALKASGLLSEYSSIAQGLRMLRAGRAPLIMSDSAAALYEARMSQVSIRALPFVVLYAPVHLMLSKASTTAADVARLNAAIGRLERNGALQAIRATYGLR